VSDTTGHSVHEVPPDLASVSLALPQRVGFVSVIVPVYNGESMIGECIEALLAQDYPKDRYEVIVVDNDSTDGTARVVQRYSVVYLFEDGGKGPYVARNAGAQQARGDLLAFCDADQLADKRWLRELVAMLQDGCVAAAGPMLAYEAKTASVVDHFAAIEAQVVPDRPAGPQRGGRVLAGTGNLLVRREAFQALGGFRQDAVWGPDRDFASQLLSLGQDIAYAPHAVQYHRPRATAGSLLRHEIRFGHARGYLRKTNPDMRIDALPVQAVRFLGGMLLSGAALLRTALLFWLYERPLHKMGLIGLGVLMKGANLVGRVGYVLGWTPPRHW